MYYVMMIPEIIAQDFYQGKAQYKTFQTGFGGQSVLSVPKGAEIVVFGYDFSPAGGGLLCVGNDTAGAPGTLVQTPNVFKPFETQQVSFFNGVEVFPFIHHVEINHSVQWGLTRSTLNVNNEPISRPVWIKSTKDLSITVGLIAQNTTPVRTAINPTDTTPPGITFGGSGIVQNTNTALSPATAPQSIFSQPEINISGVNDKYGTPSDTQSIDQVFFKPDQVNGLIEPTAYLDSLIPQLYNTTAANYFLCIHYALYNKI